MGEILPAAGARGRLPLVSPGFQVATSGHISYLSRGFRGALNPCLFLLSVGRRVTFESRIKLKAGNLGVKLRQLSPGRERSPSVSHSVEVQTEV